MKDPLSSWQYLLSRIKQFKEITNDTTRCQTMLDTGAESLLVVEKKAKIKFLLRKGELMEEELTMTRNEAYVYFYASYCYKIHQI